MELCQNCGGFFCFVLFMLFIYRGTLSSDGASAFLCSPSSTQFFQLGWMPWWSLSNDQIDKIVRILWDYFHCSAPCVHSWIKRKNEILCNSETLLSSCIFALLVGFVVCLFFCYGKFWGKIGPLLSRYLHRTLPELLLETQTTSLHFFKISLSHYLRILAVWGDYFYQWHFVIKKVTGLALLDLTGSRSDWFSILQNTPCNAWKQQHLVHQLAHN